VLGLALEALALGDRLVRYSSGDFVAEIEFDDDGFVTRYQHLAVRVR
jgi:hypothetical protein